MDREPRPLLAIGRRFDLFHRFSRRLSGGVAIERRPGLPDLIQYPICDPHINAGIRLRLLAPEDDANLAIAKSLLFVNQQSQPFRIAFGSQGAVVHDESARARVHPAWVHLPVGD